MSLRFGKLPARHDERTLRLESYLTPALPPAPPAYDVLDRVYRALNKRGPLRLFPMDGNDEFGDCTIAAAAHAVTVFRGLVGERHVLRREAVIDLYFRLTGGADTGLPALEVLKFWRSHGLADDRILAFARIDPRRHADVKQAMRLFGGIYLGFVVPEACVDQFERRQRWTPGPSTGSGHAVFAVEYDASSLTVLTWGRTQAAGWDWWDACVDEAYAILPAQAKSPGFAPGFDFEQLRKDLDIVGTTNLAGRR